MSEKFWSNIIRYYTNEVPSGESLAVRHGCAVHVVCACAYGHATRASLREELTLRRSLRFALTPVP